MRIAIRLLICGSVFLLTPALVPASWAAGEEASRAEDRFECVVLPYQVLDLSSGVSGRLASVYVERAERVRAGQVLADLESKVEQVNLSLARTRAGMGSEVGLRNAGLSFDERRLARFDDLHQRNMISAQDLDEASRAASLSQWQVVLAKDNQRLAALEARRAEAMLALRSVASPVDGVVVERYKSPGEYVDEEPILRVAQLDPLRIEVIVPLEHYRAFAPGLQAAVYPETSPDTPWQAAITAVDAVADPASGTFRARLDFPNPDHRYLAGIKCTARLLGTREAATVDVPAPGPDAVATPNHGRSPRHAVSSPLQSADVACASCAPTLAGSNR